jgi:hypothetical protein
LTLDKTLLANCRPVFADSKRFEKLHLSVCYGLDWWIVCNVW